MRNEKWRSSPIIAFAIFHRYKANTYPSCAPVVVSDGNKFFPTFSALYGAYSGCTDQRSSSTRSRFCWAATARLCWSLPMRMAGWVELEQQLCSGDTFRIFLLVFPVDTAFCTSKKKKKKKKKKS